MGSVMERQEPDRMVVWEAFPSWAQFSWLYFMSALAALRGGLFYRFGVGGWEMWVIGAVILLACAAIAPAQKTILAPGMSQDMIREIERDVPGVKMTKAYTVNIRKGKANG